MKNNKLTWKVVTLVVLTTIIVTIGHMDNFSQQNDPNNVNRQIQQKQKDYPIVDFDAPEPIDPSEREERRQKNKRYDKQHWVMRNINPKADGVGRYDETPQLTAIPIAESDFVIIGDVINSKGSMSNDKEGVYSEYTVKVEDVLKEANSNRGEAIRTITVDRAGGYVRYPNGQKVLYLINKQDLPQVGSRYIFFLTNLDHGKNYRILTGYELKDSTVIPLDTRIRFDDYKEMSDLDFINTVRNKILGSSQPRNN